MGKVLLLWLLLWLLLPVRPAAGRSGLSSGEECDFLSPVVAAVGGGRGGGNSVGSTDALIGVSQWFVQSTLV